MDVQTAFLYADREEEMVVKEPPGVKTQDKDGGPLLMKLGRTIYRLAQSPGKWLFTIDSVLIAIGFEPLKSDSCEYIHQHNGVIIILTLYVGDLLIVGASIKVIGKIKRKLTDKFRMKDMGDVSLALGVHVTRNRENGTLKISLDKQIKSIWDRFGMANCNLASTPGYDSKLSRTQSEDTLLNEEETQQYQAITSSVIYLA